MPESSRNAVVWDGDNIADVMAVLPHDNPPQYLSQFSNRDEIVGVWTPSGLKVAQIGDTIGIGDDGHPYVARRPTEIPREEDGRQ